MPRAPKQCARMECDRRVVDRTYCNDHQAEQQRRPSTRARGYDRQHEKLRSEWAPLVATGSVKCWRCGELIKPQEWWHLGHDDHDRSIIRGPEHTRRCNLRAAGAKTKGRKRSPKID